MNTLELFCGTKSFSKVMEKYGHNTYTVDIDLRFDPDECISVVGFVPKQKKRDIRILRSRYPDLFKRLVEYEKDSPHGFQPDYRCSDLCDQQLLGVEV